MKYLKTFEGEIVNSESSKALEYFFSQFNLFESKYHQFSVDSAKSANIPMFLYDDYSFLFFLYNYKGWWNNYYDKSIIDFIKREIKNRVIKSVINKFEEDPNNYILLKSVFDKRPEWNNPRSLQGLNSGATKYIFMLFYKALNSAPQWIKDSNKYNL